MTHPALTPSLPPRWDPPFLSLPVHALVRHQLTLALNNVESTVIVGPRGVGKTRTVLSQITEIRAAELRKQLAGGGASPRQILWYATGEAAGRKTVLSDIYAQLKGRPMGRRSKQDWSPTEYIRQITDVIRDEHYALICIDEAQHIDPANINHLRQLVDAAQHVGHALQLVLIGNEELPRNVNATGQLGERFTGFVNFTPFAADQVATYLAEFHPGVGALQTSLPAKQWKALEGKLFAAARGSFRRLCAILRNADELALLHGGSMTGQDLLQAIAKLPPNLT